MPPIARWTRLEFADRRELSRCLESRSQRLLFYPAVGGLKVGQLVDIDVAIDEVKTSIALKALVVGRRTRPKGRLAPRGVFLEIIEADGDRYQRLCDLADGKWQPQQLRQFPRVHSRLAASYYVPRRFHRALVTDISAGGLFLSTPAGPLLGPGQGVLVRLKVSWWRPTLELESRVCWVDEVDSRRGMGLHCFAPPKMLARLQRLAERILRSSTLAVPVEK